MTLHYTCHHAQEAQTHLAQLPLVQLLFVLVQVVMVELSYGCLYDVVALQGLSMMALDHQDSAHT